MLLFDLTPDLFAAEGHMSLPENGTIRLELTFDKPLTDAITCNLYLEYEGCVRIDKSRNVTTVFNTSIDTVQKIRTLCGVKSFLGVYPSNLLPYRISNSGTLIVNADPQTMSGSYWLAIHIRNRRYITPVFFYFDSYWIFPLEPAIPDLLRINALLWDYNRIQLQGVRTTVCGK